MQSQRAGRYADAEKTYRHVLARQPDHPVALGLLGMLAYQTGHSEDAVRIIRRAIEIDPSREEAHINLGNALLDLGRHDEALAAYRQAVTLNPAKAGAHYNVANALRATDLDAARGEYEQALRLDPNFADALMNLGNLHKDLGRLDEAIECYRRAHALRPDHPAHLSNVIYAMQFHRAYDLHAIALEQKRWQALYVDPLKPQIPLHRNSRNANRKLKVGYLSAQFFFHAECFFVLPLLENHDREHFEIYCYSSVRKPDRITERIRKSASAWRDVARMSGDAIAQRIRDDQIDILIDLAMHMGGNHLPVFAGRPAPVQVSWLAYPGSTGIDAIQYRLTDGVMEPDGGDQSWSSEEPIRLPDAWVVYDPVVEAPEVEELPALRAGHLTFGSLNDPCKVNASVIDLWARLMHVAGESSRIILRHPQSRSRESVAGELTTRGINPQRVELVGSLSRFDYLSQYNRIDIALDTFPYNGITTSCDALWMGVPVLTLPGDRPQARAGLALLTQVGLEEFAPATVEGCERLVRELIGDLPRLARVRSELRQRMRRSALMDAKRFARNVEDAYRLMWTRWCAGGDSP